MYKPDTADRADLMSDNEVIMRDRTEVMPKVETENCYFLFFLVFK